MRREEFDEIVERAYRRIPARFRSRMENIVVVVEDEPSPRQLAAARVPRSDTLLGLYEGRPLTRRSVLDAFTMPDRITIFQGPHERITRNPNELERLIHQTIWHEVAHYFGMNEAQVRSAERARRRRRQWPH